MEKLIILCAILLLHFKTVHAHPGIGIVKDSKNNIYYTDLTHVWKITPDGNRTIAVKDVHTHELFMDESDNLYGEHEYYKGETIDKWGNYVWCLGADGVFEITTPEVEGFLENNSLVRDDEGNSFWAKKSADHQLVMKHSKDGQNELLTKHKFGDVRWMYFSPTDRSLYVVDHLNVKKVGPTGKVEMITDNLKESGPAFNGVADRHYIFGVWSSAEKDVYVAIFGAGKVKRIRTNGDTDTVHKSAEGWSPCGGMKDEDGTLWILEFSKANRTRVVKLPADGNRTVYGG